MNTHTSDSDFWDSPGLLRASEEISPDQCWALIAGQTTGRLGFLLDGWVTIFPLNCVIHDRTVYFRTSPEGVIARQQISRAGFQLDHIDAGTRSGWTILVNGTLQRATDPELLKTLWGRPAEEPWAPGQRNVFFGISTEKISGRQVSPAH